MKVVPSFLPFVFKKKDIFEMKATWKDLGIKEKLAIGTALAAFTVGIYSQR